MRLALGQQRQARRRAGQRVGDGRQEVCDGRGHGEGGERSRPVGERPGVDVGRHAGLGHTLGARQLGAGQLRHRLFGSGPEGETGGGGVSGVAGVNIPALAVGMYDTHKHMYA